MTFANNIQHRSIICHRKVFFVTSMNLGSLPQNKALFGSNLYAKLWLNIKVCQWSRHFRQKPRAPSWRELVLDRLAPRMGSGSGRRTAFYRCELKTSSTCTPVVHHQESSWCGVASCHFGALRVDLASSCSKVVAPKFSKKSQNDTPL